MEWIIGLIVALVAAVLAFMYLPTPINWIVGLLILLLVVYMAFTHRRTTPRP